MLHCVICDCMYDIVVTALHGCCNYYVRCTLISIYLQTTLIHACCLAISNYTKIMLHCVMVSIYSYYMMYTYVIYIYIQVIGLVYRPYVVVQTTTTVSK